MGSWAPEIPLESALAHSKPRTPTATGAAKSKWRLNSQRPAGPGAWGWPVDAVASDGVAASNAESTWARLRDLDPRELRSSAASLEDPPGDPGPAKQVRRRLGGSRNRGEP
ncbi:hypothetical protein NDU88_004857 [Pleurodeles waltl]|uniref:Uncharacterized protein n=1 Tax=Pleurodeles waltl TaxID=8319 RepID=A0AAV7MW50_PLEWA|nr:hypothetical protein NDU88_004857 [Pleurodeles waltl]